MKNNPCYLCGNNKLKIIVNLDWPIKKCLKCRLVQVNPLPKKVEVDRLYQGDYWKNFSFYGEQLTTHKNYFRKKVEELKKYKLTGKLLDVGCALGVLLEITRKQRFDVEGIDISDFAVKQCHKLGLKVSQGIIIDIKKKNYYDIITAFEVVEHELDPLLTVKTAHNLLKKNGLLVVTVPDSGTLSSRLMGKYWFSYRNKEHLFHFTVNSLKLLLKKGGFKNVKITTDIGRYYLFTYYLERFNYYLPKSKIFKKFVNFLKKIPIINSLVVPFNPWGNIIAYAVKKNN
ncbi:MAG: Methyltransferase type 11 [Candidatus Roizmanbacteria bacterium GW2011_GWA2_32_13]|uniref:Methyltransferase type 11 n=1 Tax=Candidatus Roizmanbacteria bacterium GW2011_GWA2_32_13 TaxID=1618475 RepID=A0A0F9Z1P1_9BACT|nr:MAG: Methyltransferase type 11 [Candidatus Roizmanbacteria bacterium GW2011_GWA2_32_13]